MLRITEDEYRQRLAALERLVREADLDVFVVSSFDSIYYLTGAGFEPLERPFFLLITPGKPPALLTPRLDYEHMKKARVIGDDRRYAYREYPAPEGEGWPEHLRNLLEGAGEVGVEPSLRQDLAWELRDHAPRVAPLVERLRLVKSPAEIEMIRRAARYADLAVEQLLSASYYGATVAEGFARTRAVSTRIIREVQDWDPLTSRVLMATWAAPLSAMPHSIPSLADRLREGPHTALVLTRVNGYSAESERTYFTAAPSSEERQAYAAMMEARERAIVLVRPGVAAADIDGAVNDFLSREGFSGEERRLHRTGHGIGMGTHERPWIAEGSHDRLSENMVISIEPGVYLPGIGGFRHSDTVRVTSTGAERLTRSPDALDDLTLSGWRIFARAPALLLRPALRLSEKSPSATVDSKVFHHASLERNC